MAPRPCLVCGTPADGPRCPAHQLRKPASRAPGYDRRHRAITEQTIARWVAQQGWICPGWRRPEHPVAPGGLEGDHIIPRAVWPDLAYDPTGFIPLCRVCNASKGARIPDAALLDRWLRQAGAPVPSRMVREALHALVPAWRPHDGASSGEKGLPA